MSVKSMSIRHRMVVGCLLMAAVASLLFFYELDAKDIWERPEARTAVIARNMVDESRYLIPQLFGEPFIDNRPPGYYWLAALSFRMAGEQTEALARAPSALAAVLCTLVVFGFGCQIGGLRTGLWAGVVLLGTVKFTWQGRVAEQDMLLALWTCLSWWVLWNWLNPDEPVARSRVARLGWVVLLQVLVGLAAMTKGPAIGITFVIPAALYLTVTRRWGQIDWTMLIATSPIVIILSFWWYFYVWFQLPGEQGQLLARLLNQGDLHVRSWYYYLVKMPSMTGPVILLLPLLWWQWRNAGYADRAGAFGFWLAWFFGTFVVFSLFPSKQTHYLVPAFPGLALMLGLTLARPPDPRVRFHVLFVVLIMAVLLLGPVALIMEKERIPAMEVETAWIFLAFGVLATCALTFSLLTRRIGVAFCGAWAGWLLTIVVLLGHGVTWLDPTESAREFADRVDRALPADADLGVISNNPAVTWYLDDAPRLLTSVAEVRAWLERPGQQYLIVESDELEDQFKDLALGHTVTLLTQKGFMKHDVTASLVRERP